MEKTIYNKSGFNNRAEYLVDLADKFCIDIDTVIALAELLGPDEDFDGLITTLEDMEDINGYMDDLRELD